MNKYFAHTLVDTTMNKITEPRGGEDESPFIADLFNEKLIEIGHIQFVPKQNRVRITATISNEEDKAYHIKHPRLDFLKFLFENSNRKVKKAVRHYFFNSDDAQKQKKEKRE